jgi:chromate reductase
MSATRLLAISGSLRTASVNTAVLEAARLVAPAGVEISLWRGLASLPAFDPDRDGAPLPADVATLRAAVGGADGLLIACPEYAHGVPGAFKNALDWLVSAPEFGGKPVALVNTAARAFHAQAQLRETLVTMSARLAAEAFVTLPFIAPASDAMALAADERVAAPLRVALSTFAAFIHSTAGIAAPPP